MIDFDFSGRIEDVNVVYRKAIVTISEMTAIPTQMPILHTASQLITMYAVKGLMDLSCLSDVNEAGCTKFDIYELMQRLEQNNERIKSVKLNFDL